MPLSPKVVPSGCQAVPAKSMPLPLLLAALLSCLLPGTAEAEIRPGPTEGGNGRVTLHFFWSLRCPHCREALPFVESLERDHPWIRVEDYELTGSRANVARFVEMAKSVGEVARSVPAFFVCGRMLTGYDSPQGVGREVLEAARLCRDAATSPAPEGSGGALAAQVDLVPGGGTGHGPVRLPWLGELHAGDLSLPIFTLVIAGLDAFNPCAFFVLLFLLSLMVHARSRRRMLIVGGTFVLFSGLVYFLFMAAWLNLFLVVGGAPVVTLIAGVVAIAIGLLNTKDYFRPGEGPSLSIPQRAKPGLFKRMRALLAADSMGTMLIGAVTLAMAANSYELLCTAGFPMVYTRLLTANELSGLQYYAYLALYNLIYVLPLAAIVTLFTATLGSRKLSERQGRLLKLVSGVMMLGLGAVMLVAPELLGNPAAALGLLMLALGTAALLALRGRRRAAREGPERT
jgi:hypothetical protein